MDHGVRQAMCSPRLGGRFIENEAGARSARSGPGSAGSRPIMRPAGNQQLEMVEVEVGAGEDDDLRAVHGDWHVPVPVFL